MVPGLESFVMLAVPLFILAGHLLNSSGITSRIFTFANCLVGHFKGGLGHVNILASLIFSGMSGAAQADAAGLGLIEIRTMKKAGYSLSFSAAITAASSIIGPIIPPSIIMVLYAVFSGASLPSLFLAGIVPGFLMAITLMLTVYILVSRKIVQAPTRQKSTFRETAIAFWKAIPPLAAPLVLLIGLFTGVATPTELGAIICLYAIILGIIYKELTLKNLVKSLANTAVTCGILMFIVVAAAPYGGMLAIAGFPAKLSELILSSGASPWLILISINLLLLALGCFLETTPVMIITIPILMPIITSLGVDPIHFGIIMVINLLIGTLTPPFGVLIFVMMDVAKVKYQDMVKALMPFYFPLLLFLILITFVPAISMVLPTLFM
jgi:tripartite ATP-independent transporter DctM subunit